MCSMELIKITKGNFATIFLGFHLILQSSGRKKCFTVNSFNYKAN